VDFTLVFCETVSGARVPGGPARLSSLGLSEAASGMARARSGLAPPVRARRHRFVEALLFDVVYKNPVSSCSTSQLFIICYLHPQSTNTVLPLFPALPLRGAQSASPRSQSRPYLPCTTLPTTPQNPTFSTAPTRSSTMAASLDPGCDSPSSRTALSRLTMLYRARESTFRTLSVR
jgi:hypothetical protein